MNGVLNLKDSLHHIEKEFSISTLRDPRGILDLRYGMWYQGQGKPKQYVVFANGRTEWIEKYAYLAKDFDLSRFQAFVTWDHRGQGASGGSRAHVEDYGDFAAEAAKIIDAATQGQPYVVITHSMGGLIMLTAIMSGLVKPRALLMSSPLLGLPNRPLPRMIARPLTRALTGLGLGPINIPAVGEFDKVSFANNVLTSCPDHYDRLKATPYPCPSPTFGWLDATFRAFEFCWNEKNIASYTTPTMVMIGSEEKVVDLGAVKGWVERVKHISKAPVDLTIFEGARHELFSEADLHYRKATGVVQSFIREHLGL